MLRSWMVGGALCSVLLVGLVKSEAQGQQQVELLIHERGQGVAPIYEGWFTAPDGTTRVSFGYLNRNSKEELDIPVGPNNRLEPGPFERGQPTHFEAKRDTGVFTVTLPKDARQEITWTLTAHGATYSVPSNLGQLYEISPLKAAGPPDLTSADAPKDNATPFVRFSPEGASAQGPSGIETSVKTAPGIPVTLSIWVTDDGIPRPRPGATGRFSRGLTVDWSKYRGAGSVMFSNASPAIENGKATTSATFVERGEYTLRVKVDDHGGQGQCCWTNAYVKVDVSSPSAIGR
jgi:hypothetical protein